jgi:hypothetical protein
MVLGKEQESGTDCIWEDTMAPFKSCRSTDTNLQLESVTKWEDIGCTPGTTPEYLSPLQMHEMQRPSVSQGLYPILLLALLASTTSAYTSLSVSQDSNSPPQLLKVSVYHSATSAVQMISALNDARVQKSTNKTIFCNLEWKISKYFHWSSESQCCCGQK